MRKKTVRDVNISGKRVLVRVDVNVPFKPGTTVISDDSRIRAIMPTISYLKKHGASIILCSHLGRPGGKVAKEMRLGPVAYRLESLLGEPITYLRDCVGTIVEEASEELEPGQVLLLENLRFHTEEEENDLAFARKLASLADLYVNDAFGAAHRAHASIHAITKFLPSVAGLQMERELKMLSAALNDPARPLGAVIGGAKVSDKISVLQNLVNRVNRLFIGGGMAATFLKAQGQEMGLSTVEDDWVVLASDILHSAHEQGVAVHFPKDFVITNHFSSDGATQIVNSGQVPADSYVMDIGPSTIKAFAKDLPQCRTVLWNGPMGVFEFEPFSKGTRAVAELLADMIGAITVVGGGSTAEAVEEMGLTTGMTHVSMGGGASLEFMEGRELPGVATLPDRENT
ncbi:MAG: phosphoglycerate kinase [SAR202 cluster bacterium Io17-Chloro-G3]|nr:MAG: phosphoglycerate kinase [SAR202 cluster bacterium Io17-Chloro-G3]